MKNNAVKLSLLCCLALTSCDAQKEAGVVIKNVNIIPIRQDTLLKNHDIKIVSGRVLSVGENVETNSKDTIIDGGNGYLLPGLWDMHAHLPDKRENGLGYEQYLALNFLSGVTHIRNMRGFDSLSQATKKIAEKAILSPRIYLTPPPISEESHPPIDSIEFYIQKYKSEGYTYWKILDLPDKRYFDSLAKYAKQNQLKLAGHVSGAVGVEESITNGYSCIEHLQGYSKLLSDTSALADMLRLTRQNNVFNCATLDWYYITYLQYPLDEIYGREYLKYLPQKNIEEWKENISNYLEKLNALSKDSVKSINRSYSAYIANKSIILKKLFDAGCKLLISPDANGMFQVPGFSMIDEMKLYKKAGIPTYAILKMATSNAAEWMGEESKGFIKEGADADLALYSKNPLIDLDNLKTLKGIYFNQHWLNERSIENELKKLEQQR